MKKFVACLVAGSLTWLLGMELTAQESSTSFKTIATIAGNGSGDAPVRKGRATQLPLSNPFGVQPESDGSLVVVSYDRHVLHRLEPTYTRMEWIAGSGERGLSGRDGELPDKVDMNQPHEIQIDAQGNIYVADTMNHRVGMIDRVTGRWKNIAGTGEPGFGGDDGPATQAAINQAYSIALDAPLLFLADLKNHRVRQINLETGVISTICGTGEKALPKDGGLAIEQPLAGPRSLAVDQENLWIVLREGNSVWRIDRADGRLYHVAGTGKKGFTGDGGSALQATFAGPKGIAVDPGVAVYVADTENHAIRCVDLITKKITTIVGDGSAGFNGDGDELVKRRLNRPHGVCLLPSGELLIGDSENHRLRILRR